MGMKLSPESLDWALRHVEKYSDTNIFPRPFEYQVLGHEWSEVRNYLVSQELAKYAARVERRCITPKARFGFRESTQLDPLDCLLFTALVYEAGEQIEHSRMPSGEGSVFSYRFDPTQEGDFFRKEAAYEAFQARSRALSESRKITHVVVADVADFFPRIYLHRVRSSLEEAQVNGDHAAAIERLIKQWNHNVSYGIPVGPRASNLLAEITLNPVDRALKSQDILFVRYVDDYRLFCQGERKAYRSLIQLANELYRLEALTLQQHKTKIMPVEEFVASLNVDVRDDEVMQAREKFQELISKAGDPGPYEQADLEMLSSEERRELEQLRIVDILFAATQQFSTNIQFAKFVLRALTQLNRPEPAVHIVKKLEAFYPVVADVMKYFSSVAAPLGKHREVIGWELLRFLRSSLIADLPYNRMWMAWLLSSGEWGRPQELVTLYNENPEHWSRRKLVLGLGRTGQSQSFASRSRDYLDLSSWERRAFFYGATCMPHDQRVHWLQYALTRSDDPLDKAVIQWALVNPISST